MDARELTKALDGRWYGSYGLARCPAHDDRNPSLSIQAGDKAILVRCHAGCETIKIIDELKRCGVWSSNNANRRYLPSWHETESTHGNRFWHGHLDEATGDDMSVAVHYTVRRTAFEMDWDSVDGNLPYSADEKASHEQYLELVEADAAGSHD